MSMLSRMVRWYLLTGELPGDVAQVVERAVDRLRPGTPAGIVHDVYDGIVLKEWPHIVRSIAAARERVAVPVSRAIQVLLSYVNVDGVTFDLASSRAVFGEVTGAFSDAALQVAEYSYDCPLDQAHERAMWCGMWFRGWTAAPVGSACELDALLSRQCMRAFMGFDDPPDADTCAWVKAQLRCHAGTPILVRGEDAGTAHITNALLGQFFRTRIGRRLFWGVVARTRYVPDVSVAIARASVADGHIEDETTRAAAARFIAAHPDIAVDMPEETRAILGPDTWLRVASPVLRDRGTELDVSEALDRCSGDQVGSYVSSDWAVFRTGTKGVHWYPERTGSDEDAPPPPTVIPRAIAEAIERSAAAVPPPGLGRSRPLTAGRVLWDVPATADGRTLRQLCQEDHWASSCASPCVE